jgi:hypothetical protein
MQTYEMGITLAQLNEILYVYREISLKSMQHLLRQGFRKLQHVNGEKYFILL